MRNSFRYLIFLTVLCLSASTPAEAQRPTGDLIFSVEDPLGDDHGAGEVIYPTGRTDLEPGDLDLIEFAALTSPGGTIFRATFARPVREPGPEVLDGLGTSRRDVARFGFYTFNLDLYVDTDREPGSGEVAMLPGRKAQVAAPFAWEKVVALTPRPYTLRSSIRRARVEEWKDEERRKRTVSRSDVRQKRKEVAEELMPLLYLPIEVKTFGRQVQFFVPEEFLGGKASRDWGYTVVISGAQLRPRVFQLPGIGKWSEESSDGLILPVVWGTESQAFGGGLADEPLQSPLIDVLVPAGAQRTQEEILRDFDSYQERRVQIPGVVPGR